MGLVCIKEEAEIDVSRFSVLAMVEKQREMTLRLGLKIKQEKERRKTS